MTDTRAALAAGTSPAGGAAEAASPTGRDGERAMGSQVATLGGGCFWCLEAVFEQLRGVLEVTPGYAGGADESPTYERVCQGTTGHAEVVQVVFDPSVLPYEQLLEVFLTIHDPTTRDRQGADVGSQYRSIVLFSTPEQEAQARASIARLDEAAVYDAPIVTEVRPLVAFHPAEEYHRRYFRRNPGQGYCRAVVAPKVAKFRRRHQERLREPR